MSWIVFLRGINVNGIKIAMSALSDMFKQAGFNEVETVLATGNVILTGERAEAITADALHALSEKWLSETFHYEAKVLVYKREELSACLEASKAFTRTADRHLYCILCQNETVSCQLEEAYVEAEGEKLLRQGRMLLWQVPKTQTLDSVFGKKVLGSKAFKALVTTRNLQTIEKILAKTR